MIIKPVLETVFLPYWSTQAVICKDGSVYIYLEIGKAYDREMLLNEPYFNKKKRETMLHERLELFDELEAYYETIKDK